MAGTEWWVLEAWFEGRGWASPVCIRPRLARAKLGHPYGFVVDKRLCRLVDYLQAELDYARREGAGDLAGVLAQRPTADAAERYGATGSIDTGGCALRAADDSSDVAGSVAWKIKIRVVEGVVELGTELDFQTLNRSVEVLIQRDVGLI